MLLFLSSSRTLTFLLLFSIILCSCGTKLQPFKSPFIPFININENFTIEGKFKIKINQEVQSGYFHVTKTNSSVSLRMGKNFILPERIFYYKLDNYLKLSEISETSLSGLEENLLNQKLEIKFLLKTLLGKPILKNNNNWEIFYPEGFHVVEGYEIPISIQFIYKSVNLEILLKRIVKIK